MTGIIEDLTTTKGDLTFTMSATSNGDVGRIVLPEHTLKNSSKVAELLRVDAYKIIAVDSQTIVRSTKSN